MARTEQQRGSEREDASSNKKKKGKGKAMSEFDTCKEVEEEEEEEEEDAGATSARSGSTWPSFADPESKRKRRVASYKAYHVPRQLKASLSHSFRWLKSKYTHITYTW